MSWSANASIWLLNSAIAGLLLTVSGTLALRFCRQPVIRLRIVEAMLLASLLAPALMQAPGLPRWSPSWLRTSPATPATVAAIPSTSIAPAAVDAVSPDLSEDLHSGALVEPGHESARLLEPAAENHSAGTPPATVSSRPPIDWATWIVTVYLIVACLLALRFAGG